LAKTVAGYYNFDYDNVSAVSSGGDIGYRGVINKEKIGTDAQKMSFLAGVFLRYGRLKNPDGHYSIPIPLHSTAKECVDILKEFGCDNVKEIRTKYKEEKIGFNASNKIRDLIMLVDDLFNKISGMLIVY
jgi:DNA-binding transcriptional regulator WhiA